MPGVFALLLCCVYCGTLLRSLLSLFVLFTVACIFVVWVLHFVCWLACADCLRLFLFVGLV